MKESIPTAKRLQELATRLRAAYREECERGECRCMTNEEHERMIAYS